MASVKCTSRHPSANGHKKAHNGVWKRRHREQVGTNEEDAREKQIRRRCYLARSGVLIAGCPVTAVAVTTTTLLFAAMTVFLFGLIWKLIPVLATYYTDRQSKQINDQMNVTTGRTKEPKPHMECANCKFTCLEVSIERFKNLVSSLETIKGILTICAQDFPNASPFLHGDDHLNKTSVLSEKTVQIFLAHPFHHKFEFNPLKTKPNMNMDSVVKTIKECKTFSIMVIDSSTQESVFEALKETHIQKAGVVIVGNSQQLPVLPNVNLRQTDLSNIMKDMDSLLECCAFEMLKNVHSNLQMLPLQNTLSEHDVVKLEDMLDLIKSAFTNSDIPADDIPDVFMNEEFLFPSNITEVIEQIVAIPGVIVCFKKRGMLQIYIDQSETGPDTESLILHKLHENGVNKYSFVYGKTKRLAVRKTGNLVFQVNGTLGGFAKKVALPLVSIGDQSEESPQNATSRIANTVALVSRHVVQQALFPFWLMDVGSHPISLDNDGNVQRTAEIDILPVDVNEAYAHLCDPRFKTEYNISMYSQLRNTGDIRTLIGKPVHIWGAKTSPGRGMLVAHDGRAVNGLMIFVRDRYEDEPFAQEGDSGAMVCYFDQRNEVLYAVAMLIESVQLEGEPKRYKAQILDDGLQKLSLATGYQFLIFEDEREDGDIA